ncbi:MAG: 4Fe-4S binding protein, partial [Magnetococcales bacterium]|nr:4Fe-4S binding protein [Magnetococcales bacterium]
FGQLTAWRRWIQALAFLLTVYGGIYTGPYLADKISRSFPSLSCVYDGLHGTHCALISLQHQTHHQVGESLAKGAEVGLTLLKPLGITLFSFLLFFLVLNKAFCGWICPLGTFQEWLFMAGRRLGLVFRRITPDWLGKVRPVKWLILLLFIFVLPLLTGLGLLPHAFGDPFCRICPSRIVTTLFTGDLEQLSLATRSLPEEVFGWLGNVLFGFMVATAMVVRQPFCRICPMLSLHALFRRFAPMQLSKPDRHRCGSCTNCYQACPMDIPEIASQSGAAAFHEDCILCGRCAEYCPRPAVITLKWGPWVWFASQREYCRQRFRGETPEGLPR